MTEQRRYGKPYIIREFEYVNSLSGETEYYIVTGQQYLTEDKKIERRRFTWKLEPNASNPYP